MLIRSRTINTSPNVTASRPLREQLIDVWFSDLYFILDLPRWVSPRFPDCSTDDITVHPPIAHRGFYFYIACIRANDEMCRFFREAPRFIASERKMWWDPVNKVRPSRSLFPSFLIPLSACFPSNPRGSYATSSRVSAITSDSPVDCLVQRRALSMLYLVDRYMSIFYDCADSLIN